MAMIATLSGTALERAVRGLTTIQVAERYDVTTQTVSRWCQRGLIPGAYRDAPGHPWRIPLTALDNFVCPMAGRPNAHLVNAQRCVACTIILDEKWCTWDDAGLCDVCQKSLAAICRRTGQGRDEALAAWVAMGEENARVVV